MRRSLNSKRIFACYPSTKNTNRLRYFEKDETDKLLDKLKENSRTQYEMAYISLYTGMRGDKSSKRSKLS